MTGWVTIALFSVCLLASVYQHDRADFVALSRTGCYGACPAFEVTIYSTGKVIFRGDRYVAIIGRREYRVNVDSAKSLFSLARQIGFFSMPRGFFGEPDIRQLPNGSAETTHTQVSDHAGRLITVCLHDTTKTVQDDWGVSLGIAELERAIHRVARTTRLINKE